MLALARCRGRFAGIVVHRPPPPLSFSGEPLPPPTLRYLHVLWK